MGLCGPVRTDLAAKTAMCGFFRVPPLRNVAVRRAFFHNGVFHTLEQVMDFYVQRDSNPGKFYPTVHGQVQAYDDLPPALRNNVNQDPPFGRKPGGPPALTSPEIRDVIAFLNTLTDADAQ